jgi:single-stranded-DNA-specific exonuclease
MAAGLSIKDGVFDELYDKIQELTEGIEYEPVTPDLDIELNKVTWQLLEDIERMAPFGKGNPKPKFLSESCKLNSVSVTSDGKHLRFKASDDSTAKEIQAIGFQMSDKEDMCKQGPVNLIYQPGINEWKGRKSLQLVMKGIS